MPRQSRPKMVVKSFRISETTWEAMVARAEREGLNPTEVVRALVTQWSTEDDS